MKKHRIVWAIMKRCHADKLIYSFITSFIFTTIVITLIEPGITGFGEGLWYTFVAATSIGFGDIVPVTLVGRLMTVYIVINEILLIGVLPGVVVNYYTEVVNIKEKESLTLFLDKLEHLPELSQDELMEISKKVKKIR